MSDLVGNPEDRFSHMSSHPTLSLTMHYQLVSSVEKISIGHTGNQNHPDLEVRVVLVTCVSNIDFL